MSELRVISCNVRDSAARDAANAWAHRRDALLWHLASLDADVTGTQEVMADQHDDLRAGLSTRARGRPNCSAPACRSSRAAR